MANNIYAEAAILRLNGPQPVFTDATFRTRVTVYNANGTQLPGNEVTVTNGYLTTFYTASTVNTVFLKGDDGNPIQLFAHASASAIVVTGSKGANAALTSLMSALAQIGIVVDQTT